MKNELKIPARELMKAHISPELKEQRKKIAEEFKEIIKERQYPKEKNMYLAF